MKRLTLIRHAKASSALDENDFDRPLSPQGLIEAPEMARQFARQGDRPDRMLTSGAVRALTTARIFAEALELPDTQLEVLPEIYSAYDTTLVNLLQWQPDRCRHLALVGHNPAISQLAQYLSGRVLNLNPCGVLQLQLSITQWCELSEACGSILHHEYPK